MTFQSNLRTVAEKDFGLPSWTMTRLSKNISSRQLGSSALTMKTQTIHTDDEASLYKEISHLATSLLVIPIQAERARSFKSKLVVEED